MSSKRSGQETTQSRRDDAVDMGKSILTKYPTIVPPLTVLVVLAIFSLGESIGVSILADDFESEVTQLAILTLAAAIIERFLEYSLTEFTERGYLSLSQYTSTVIRTTAVMLFASTFIIRPDLEVPVAGILVIVTLGAVIGLIGRRAQTGFWISLLLYIYSILFTGLGLLAAFLVIGFL